MGRRVKTWTLIGGIVVLVVIGAVVAVPALVPADAIRDRVITAVRQATGRDLAIKGGVSVSVFPTLGVAAKDVSLSNAPWAGPQPLASLAAVELKVKVLPLLSGRVAVDKVVLDNPVINLATDSKGQANWRFTPEGGAAAKPAPQNAASPTGTHGAPEITLADVRLVNGKVVYTDGASGRSQTIDGINLKVSLPNFDGPLAATGEARWQHRNIGLAMNAGQARALLEGAGSPVHLGLTGDLLRLDFGGTAALAGPAQVDGDMDLAVPSLRDLATAAGVQAASLPPNGLKALALKSHLRLNGKKFAADGMQLAVDDIRATGQLSADTSGARPAIGGKIDVARLDVTPYMPPPSKAEEKPAAPQGWSDQHIDASGLRSADAQLTVTAGSIIARKIEIGRTVLRLALNNGKLVTDLAEMTLYGGRAQGRMAVDGSGPALATQANFSLEHLQAGPLLQAMADNDRFSGTAAGQVDLASKGGSQRQLVSALSGKGRVAVTNGSIKGIDLAGMVKNVTSAFGGGGGSPSKTDFSDLSGSFTATNGIVKNSDLSLKSPLLRLTGSGTVNLPEKSLDYRLAPEVAAAGVSVPVVVHGPWASPSFAPDVTGAISKRLGGEADKALNALTGGQSPTNPQQAQTPGGGQKKSLLPVPIPGLGH